MLILVNPYKCMYIYRVRERETNGGSDNFSDGIILHWIQHQPTQGSYVPYSQSIK